MKTAARTLLLILILLLGTSALMASGEDMGLTRLSSTGDLAAIVAQLQQALKR